MKGGAFQFLEDNEGGFSATRLAFLLWSSFVLLAWLYASFREGELKSIPPDVVALIGVLTTGKVIQRFGENSTQLPPKPAAPAIKPPVAPEIAKGEDIRE